MPYAFGDGVLDTQHYVLHRAGQPIRLRPKVFQVLVYLLTQRERVVAKQELSAQVWKDGSSATGRYRAPSPLCGGRWEAARGITVTSTHCMAMGIASWRQWRSIPLRILMPLANPVPRLRKLPRLPPQFRCGV
jgi:hypothetical protein